MKTALPPGDSNWSDGSGKEALFPPSTQGAMSRSVRPPGLVDLRPDFWIIGDELRTWVGSGT